MRILFLHLSDAHLKENTRLSEINPNAIVNSLSQMGDFDECIMFFSGDIVQGGGENEYKIAGQFFGRVLKGISEKYLNNKHIHVIVIPGNHDNSVKNPKRDRDILKSYYVNKTVDENFKEDLAELNNFYKFADRNRCFHIAKIVEVQSVLFEHFKIKINLINSAPFSLLGSDNGDKGMHYIPEYELNKLNWDRGEQYTITVLHHGPEWFSGKPKASLYEKVYKNSNLILVGHEHFSKNEDKIVNGKQKIDISTGIALYGTNTEHGFNAIILDVDRRTLVGYKYIYNGTIYQRSNTPVLKNDKIIFKGKNNFTHTTQFRDFLTMDVDQREGENYLSYFVFPLLESRGHDNDMKNYSASSLEKFEELMAAKRTISIEGASRTGKSILAKYLCYSLAEKFVLVYLTKDDFGAKDNHKIIKYALEQQYGEDVDVSAFYQMDKKNTVLIVDRNDKVPKDKWLEFLADVGPQFGHILLFCGMEWNIDINEKALEQLTEDNTFYMKISPFYYSKRKELISKICSSYKEYKLVDITKRVERINNDITNELKLFQLTPEFIYQYVTYCLNFPNAQTNDRNVFNRVFEGNITYRISKNAKEEDVPEILIAFDYIAYRIHFGGPYPLPIEEFNNAVNQYNIDYDNTKTPLSSKVVYDVGIKSNIIKEIPNKFEIAFCDNNLLAYFVACHLNRIINEDKGNEDLSCVLKNICFNINRDIILFLSYITSNTKILTPIINSITNHMGTWEELDIDKNNIEYLTRTTNPVKMALPDKKEKKAHDDNKTEMEKEYVEKHQKHGNEEKLYLYDESEVNDFDSKIGSSIAYLESVAKILPNFRHIMDGEKRQTVTDILYRYPNKLLYFMLKDIDEKLDSAIKKALDMNPKTKKGMLITKDMLTKSIQNQSIAFILSVYDFVAETAAAGKAMNELNGRFDFESNSNYKVQNIMMEESIGNAHGLYQKAEKLYDGTNSGIIKQMVLLIMRKHFLTHDVAIVGNMQRIVAKFFSQDEQKDLRMIQAQNKFTRK
ncbi:MAG: hypothetical protein HFG76_03745 [Hungatella sp.]|nr:hypothetical protein [Hungatella sp.]